MNITDHLYEFAEANPDKPAFLHPERLSFGELIVEIDRVADGFRDCEITVGTRTMVLIKPGIDLFAVTFALFRIGAVPVMIDPGMGLRRMIEALADKQVEAFVGIPRAHLLRYLSPSAFKYVKIWISTGFRWFGRGFSLKKMKYPVHRSEAQEIDPEDLAAIFFTSGSTGTPKGVLYKTRMLQAQIEYLKSHFKYGPDEIDLCTFPLIGLMIICHGISIVLADMDMVHPGRLNPRRVLKNIQDFKCSHMFCSPMVLNRLSAYGIKNNIMLGSMKKIMTAGAPVSESILRNFRKLLPSHAEIHTPFGATEALPVTDILDGELLKLYANSGRSIDGLCIGYPLVEIELKIISISDHAVLWTEEIHIQSENEVGEIIICGPNVTDAYWANEEANRLAKIVDAQTNTVWHRTGDLGRIDREGRVWFFGRKTQRVVSNGITYFTIPVEAVFNQHPEVHRSALVGVKRRGDSTIIPVICIERIKSKKRKIYLQEELKSMTLEYDFTGEIKNFLFHKNFPVDPRHNAKIYREKLAIWANNKLLL